MSLVGVELLPGEDPAHGVARFDFLPLSAAGPISTDQAGPAPMLLAAVPWFHRFGGEERAGGTVAVFGNLFSWLFEGVYRGDEDGERHLEAIRALQPQRDDAFEHDYLYSCLSVLDSKAQALLSYDGILMAASSITLSMFSRDITTGSVLVFSSLVVSVVSSALCLSVVWVHWTDTGELENSEDLFLKLLHVRNRRTLSYRISWIVAQLAAILLLLGVVLQRRAA
ncbi:hypothetical protein ACFY2Z_00665 [Streptomyces sp. NPDC001222]|uniref:hypothetical protein n=1 Tax=Streptomyces sp. NPDC001222 TaxID=3364548 RepID=UPI0036A3CDC5